MADYVAAQSAGQMVVNSVRIYLDNFLKLVMIAAGLEIPALVVGLVPALGTSNPLSSQGIHQLLSYLGGLLQLLAGAAVMVAAAQIAAGLPPSLQRSYAVLRRHGWKLLVAYLIVVAGVVVVGLILAIPASFFWPTAGSDGASARAFSEFLSVALMMFGLFAVVAVTFVYLAPAAPAALVERLRPLTALLRSWRLVKGRFWRTLGAFSLTIGLAGAASLLLFVALGELGKAIGLPGAFGAFQPGGRPTIESLREFVIATGVYGGLVTLLTMPLYAIPLLLLYLDLRARKEGLDRAALAAELAR